jgi:hypothetical protein
MGLAGSLVQSSHDPAYTRAGMPATRAAKYARLARIPTTQ